jgi:addiction module HigA family antidote
MWPLGCSIDQAARLLDISPLHMQGFIDGSIDMDEELATKLPSVFGRTADFWSNLQSRYEDWSTYNESRNAASTQQRLETAKAGLTLNEAFLAPRGITAEELARRLKLPVRYIRKLLSGSGKMYGALAHKLAETFGTTREYWLNMLPKQQQALMTA